MTDITKELLSRVKQAQSDGIKLNIIGRASKSFLGRKQTGEPLSVADHSGIVSYQPVELVMTARAGTTLQEIKSTLDEQGQMMAFEPPSYSATASIGGTLACNLSGSARPWNGSVRDAVLGIKLINGKAEQLNFGGQVMKNVAGYDVSRMQAGAMGTLGIITDVSFKVMPKPATTLTLVEEMTVTQAIETMNNLAGKAKPLTGACWFDNKLYLRLSGAQSAVTGTAHQWSGKVIAQGVEDSDDFWHLLNEQKLNFFNSDLPLWRFSIKPSALHFMPKEKWLIDWGGAQRWLRGDFKHKDLEQRVVEAGGQVSLFRGGDRQADVFHSQPKALKILHQRLKHSIDPDGIFNPGRLYSWL